MSFTEKSCVEFVDVLASKSAVPGGGGASALVGAIGTALGSMVGNLTVGKKKYADVEADVYVILDKAAKLQSRLLKLVEEDAVAFEPLSKAYGIPKDDPKRATVMENALKVACSVPMDIMRVCCAAIDLHAELSEKGSMLALSDVGVGVICCKSALMGASLNVFINTKSMTDRAYAADIEQETDEMLNKYCTLADKIYASVVGRLR
jgi:formiminotetrahydrofolate cyclodeaminase